MEILVEITLEAFEHIDHLGETSGLQHLTGIHRAPTTTTDEQHRPRPVRLDQTSHLVGKARIDFPVRPVLPCDMLGTHRMTNVHVLDLCPAIDENGLRVGLQESMGGKGIKMLHGHIAMFDDANIIGCAHPGVNSILCRRPEPS